MGSLKIKLFSKRYLGGFLFQKFPQLLNEPEFPSTNPQISFCSHSDTLQQAFTCDASGLLKSKKANSTDLLGRIQLFLVDVLSYNQPLPCDCPSARLIFWAGKHSWTKALQPGLLMSSTENAETPFSFKATAHLHASQYALSLPCIALSVWTGSETSCLPQEGKQRRHILHEDKLLQSRWW